MTELNYSLDALRSITSGPQKREPCVSFSFCFLILKKVLWRHFSSMSKQAVGKGLFYYFLLTCILSPYSPFPSAGYCYLKLIYMLTYYLFLFPIKQNLYFTRTEKGVGFLFCFVFSLALSIVRGTLRSSKYKWLDEYTNEHINPCTTFFMIFIHKCINFVSSLEVKELFLDTGQMVC